MTVITRARRARLSVNEAVERAQAGLALETRVGSAIWIARTKDLIDHINAAPGALPNMPAKRRSHDPRGADHI